VVQGRRPGKPENASAIGLSDPLWSFTERCWDGDMKLRPKIVEVVTHLRATAAKWDGLMPPCVQAENAATELMSDSMEHSELGVLILRWHCPLSNGAVFRSAWSVVSEGPIESVSFNRPSISPTESLEEVAPTEHCEFETLIL
jgi:hypothetical protein